MDLADENQQQFVSAESSSGRPALSPLLTSLLKSPSQVSNTSVLHTAIASQRQTLTTNPTIASLLNSSAGVNVSPGLQHLVSTAITQEQVNQMVVNDLLEDAADSIPNIKMEDLECSMLSSDEPLPEIKNEEVEVIISDLIENADDIVNDPEQHLKLDDNEDIITNLENVLEELEEEEKEEEQLKQQQQAAQQQAAQQQQVVVVAEKEMPKIDPFEFEEEPEYTTPAKPSSLMPKQQQEVVVVKEQPQQQQQMQQKTTTVEEENREVIMIVLLFWKGLFCS